MKKPREHDLSTCVGLLVIAFCSISGQTNGIIVGCTFLICGELGAIADAIAAQSTKEQG